MKTLQMFAPSCRLGGVALILALAACSVPAGAADSPQSMPRLPFTLTPLGEQRPDFVLRQSVISPNGQHVANIVSVGNHRRIWLDGVEGPLYDEIDPLSLAFSPDGQRLAYTARRRRLWYVVADGKESRGVDSIVKDRLRFSPDSRRVAFVAYDNERFLALMDDQDLAEFPEITVFDSLTFSPDSRRVAVATGAKSKVHVALDGETGPALDELARGSITFSPDGRRLAYIGKRNKQMVVVVDGKETVYETVGSTGVKFSPDSRRYALAYTVGDRWHISDSGSASPPCDGVASPTFSPDGSRLAYLAVKKGRHFVVVDGKEHGPFDKVFSHSEKSVVLFSPDSKRVAFAAATGDRQCAVLDGTPGPMFKAVGSLTLRFSPDSRQFVYVAQPDAKQCHMVIDGKPGKTYEMIFPASIRFGPDSKHLYFAARDAQGTYLVMDGVQSKAYANVGDYAVSPDSKRLGYPAQRSPSATGGTATVRANWLAVIDGVEHPAFDDISTPIFSSNSQHVAYVAQSGSQYHIIADGQMTEAIDLLFTPARFDGPTTLSAMVGRLSPEKRVQYFRLAIQLGTKR